MNPKRKDNKTDRLMGPSGTFAGYFLMIAGVIGTYYNVTGLILVVAGLFMSFTYEGTIIDYNSARIKSYTCLFGLFRVGKWHSVSSFKKFSIYRSRRSYTTYSRANIPLTLRSSDIRLALLNDTGSLKVMINRYDTFEAARKEMSELISDLDLAELDEWKIPKKNPAVK
ncbi:MAG: hypothetical protein JXB49_02390 [Bacteroidales bacterium]|nr:hypothetical protein [Bacteroidales bacterium]